MSNSLSFNPTNGDSSSSKIPLPASLIPTLQDRRARDHHPHPHPQVNLQYQTIQPTRDSELIISDPTSASLPVSAPSRSISISRSPPPVSTTPSVRYRECLKNHAASMGGLVVDGCGEFMPGGEEGTAEALKCAACECHRNFHRKEIVGESACAANCYHKNITQPLPQHLPAATVHQNHRYPLGFSSAAPTMMAFGGDRGAPAESSSEDLNNLQGQGCMQRLKKRFRTKFSQYQKEKMMEFAERLEWKIQKQDEQEVQQFCSKVSVKRKVFKVWMHNNKQAMKKKQI